MNRDISNWGWGQILELPDHLFGRRSVVGCSLFEIGGGTGFDVSMLGLPEKCVIWELRGSYVTSEAGVGIFSIALGDHLPANDAEFNLLETLLPDLGRPVDGRREIAITSGSSFNLAQLKVGVDSGGRRLVVRFLSSVVTLAYCDVSLVVSSVPRSIPEWFV